MPAILIAALTLAPPLVVAAGDGCGDNCVARVDWLCIYEIPNPPFFEVRPCDDQEVQSLKLG
jgi:hypothetical protein